MEVNTDDIKVSDCAFIYSVICRRTQQMNAQPILQNKDEDVKRVHLVYFLQIELSLTLKF